MYTKKRGNDSKRDPLSRRDFLKVCGLSSGALALSSMCNVQFGYGKDVYPADKITFIVPTKPGGGQDIYARIMTPFLKKYLKEVSPGAKGGDIVVRNEDAGSGRKALSMIFNTDPDGYTIGIGDYSIVIDSFIEPIEKPEFDFFKFTFLSRPVVKTRVIVTSKNGFKSWGEAVSAMAKGPVKTAVSGFGRTNHVTALIINDKMRLNFKLIIFQSIAEAAGALIRGDAQLSVGAEDSFYGLLQSKELRVLLRFAEVSKDPWEANIKGLGFPELIGALSGHIFLLAPPGLAAEPKNILLAAMKKTDTDKEFLAMAAKAGISFNNLYESEAEKEFQKVGNFYEDMGPLLKKYLR